MSTADRRCFHTLDGLRGIAAMAVACGHLHNLFGRDLFPGYNLAVDVFFLLSGFVLAHAYDEPLMLGGYAGRFMRLRILRLYPLFLLSLLIAWFGALVGGETRPSSWLAQIFNVICLPAPPNLSTETFPLNRPLWTLCVELAVNVVYAVGFRWWSTRTLACIWIGTALLFAATTLHNGALVNGVAFGALPVALLRVIASFTVGILMRRLIHSRPISSDLGVLAILGLFTAILLIEPSGHGKALFDIVAVLCLFPVLVAGASRTEPTHPRMADVMAKLGLCSYALYVLHIPLAALAVAMFGTTFSEDLFAYAPWSGIVLLPVTLGASYVITVRVDKPLRAALNRLVSAPNTGAIGLAPPIESPSAM